MRNVAAGQCCQCGSVTAAAAQQDDALLAYQIAFDLVDNELQSFILRVRSVAVLCITDALKACCVNVVAVPGAASRVASALQ
jgi:predicted TIM-barrel enzyme